MSKNKKNKPKLEFKDLEGFFYDFIDLMEEKNPDILLKHIQEEMITDCVTIKEILIDYEGDSTIMEYAVNYIGKYGYFIYNFEKLNEFEHCATVYRMSSIMLEDLFNVEIEIVKELIGKSITNYRKRLDGNV